MHMSVLKGKEAHRTSPKLCGFTTAQPSVCLRSRAKDGLHVNELGEAAVLILLQPPQLAMMGVHAHDLCLFRLLLQMPVEFHYLLAGSQTSGQGTAHVDLYRVEVPGRLRALQPQQRVLMQAGTLHHVMVSRAACAF